MKDRFCRAVKVSEVARNQAAEINFLEIPALDEQRPQLATMVYWKVLHTIVFMQELFQLL
jgi:hypothetical protein